MEAVFGFLKDLVCVSLKHICGDFLAAVREKGDYLEQKLRELPAVKGVRRMGLMVGIEIDGDAHDIAAKCVENGLLIITANAVLRMLPPLTITREELKEAVSILKSTLKECK